MKKQTLRLCILWIAAATSGTLHAQDNGSADARPVTDSVAEIDLFDGMREKQIEVKVIPLGAHKTNIIIENKTNEPYRFNCPQPSPLCLYSARLEAARASHQAATLAVDYSAVAVRTKEGREDKDKDKA